MLLLGSVAGLALICVLVILLLVVLSSSSNSGGGGGGADDDGSSCTSINNTISTKTRLGVILLKLLVLRLY